MKTKDNILDEIAQEYGYDDFDDAMMECHDTTEFKELIMDAMAAYNLQTLNNNP